MLTQGELVEAHALKERGWTISAIARHLGRDRKTIRSHLAGKTTPGARRPAGPDRFGPFEEYCRIRLEDDRHVWATTLFDEVADLGYGGSYQSFTRALRARGLRPHCRECAAARAPGEFASIDHPAGEETQFDWIELPDPPQWWGWGKTAHLLTGALSHSGAWRGVLAESEEQAWLVASLHACCQRLGGLTRRWRFDRMATVCYPATGEVTPSFARAAMHYSVIVDICPPRSGWRKGVAGKANDSAAQRWWRTVPDDFSPARAQAGLDDWCERKGDARRRVRDGQRLTVGQLRAGELLRPVPEAPFPAVVEDSRTVTTQALVPWHGNFYSVPPGHAGQQVTVTFRLGDAVIGIVTGAGVTLARHYREPDHAGAVVRAGEHVAALEARVLAARGQQGRPHRHKERRPPSAAALAAAEEIAGRRPGGATVTDFAAWAAAARPLRPAAPGPAGGSAAGQS